MLKDILEGIDVIVSLVLFLVWIDWGSCGDFEIILGGWVVDYVDFSSFLDFFVIGNNYNCGCFLSKVYDELIEVLVIRDVLDFEKCWEDMVKVEKLLIGEEIVLVLFY